MDNNVLVNSLKAKNSDMIDELLNSDDFLDAQNNVKVTNYLRWSMAKIINNSLENMKDDPKMIAQYRGLIKELDQAVFMLARLSQEDKHLDNEELVAKALNEVTRSIRSNPYKERNEYMASIGEDNETVDLPELPDGEFEFVEGAEEVGLIQMTHKVFVEDVIPTLKAETTEEPDDTKPVVKEIQRSSPLPAPLPGSFQP